MTNHLGDEIREVLTGMENQEGQEQHTPPDEIQDIYVLIVREHEEVEEDQSKIVESAPVPATTQIDSTPAIPKQQPFDYVTLGIVLLCCIPMLASIFLQVYLLQNPAIATVTIIPKSQQLTLNGTLEIGRLLNSITISQTATTDTTGHRHQDARNATGTVTFFNGLFTQQFIANGTVYTGQDGVEIVTTQDATIPPGSPNTGYGTVTVTAQSLEAGSKGNIRSGDIDIAINNGLLVRNSQFYNGQDERNFQTVSKRDIDRAASPLKATLAQSMTGALAAQAKQDGTIITLPCSPTISPNHRVGDEAIQVKVTVSETCTAVAYNSQELEEKATALLTTQANKKLSGYSLFGDIQTRVIQATTTHNLVFLSFKATGTWVYGLNIAEQQHIKELIAGKSKQDALHLLASLLGIAHAAIEWSDDTKLPRNAQKMRLHILVQTS